MDSRQANTTTTNTVLAGEGKVAMPVDAGEWVSVCIIFFLTLSGNHCCNVFEVVKLVDIRRRWLGVQLQQWASGCNDCQANVDKGALLYEIG